MISIIIPHANSCQSLESLLSSLQRQKCDLPFEVVVVANPMNKYQSLPTFQFSFPLIWEKSEAGANAARQRGVQVAKGEVLLFLDDDCHVSDPQFLQKHADRHQDKELMGLGGRYQLVGKTSLYGRVYNKLQNDWLNNHRLPYGFNLHLLGGNGSYKKAVFQEEGFDPRLIFGGTETEFQIRLYKKKFRLRLFEDLTIDHDGSLGFWDFLRKSFKQGMGSGYIASLHVRPPKFIFFEAGERYVTWPYRWAEWIYRVSFEAGLRYFDERRELKVKNSVIYRGILQEIFRRIGRRIFKMFLVWRDASTIEKVVAKNLLSSSRNSEKNSAENPHKS